MSWREFTVQCGKCGAQNKDKSRFCTTCGAPLPSVPPNAGQAGGSDAGGGGTKPVVPGPDKAQKAKKTDKKIALVAAIAAVVAVLAIVGVVMLMPKGPEPSGDQSATNEAPADQETETQEPAEGGTVVSDDTDDDEPIYIEPVTPEEAFEHAEVVSSIDAADSPDVQSEKEVVDLLEKRGFTDIALTTDYEADGAYIGEQEVDGTSSAEHPIYETTYIASDGSVWALLIYNGQLMANPLSYNNDGNEGAQVVLSETEEVTSYDSATNTFYRIIPDGTELEVKVVDRIDAEKLDEIGYWGVVSL